MAITSAALIYHLNFIHLFLKVSILLSSYYGRMDNSLDNIRLNQNRESQQDTFDFIIGGGSSGSVLTQKISKEYNVLLLEAGGKSSPISSVPNLAFPLFTNIPEDWRYETVPQKYSSFAKNNNITLWTSGKGLGGSSLINGMIYNRGRVQGFDAIAERTGDPIWKMRNLLRYYKTIEDYNGYYQRSVHGKGGGIHVESSHLSPYTKYLLLAGEELGYRIQDPDPYGPLPEGFTPMELFAKNGARWSAYDGYIKPVMNKRRTLTIRKYSYVHKIILDENNTAIGVQYLRHGRNFTAMATKEIILCAGAIQTPKILLLSGIGPKDDLDKLGITTRVDLPVGRRLQDKFGANVGPFTVDSGNSLVASRNIGLNSITNYLFHRKGFFSTSGADATYAIRSGLSSSSTPDILSYTMTFPLDKVFEKVMYRDSLNFNPEFIQEYLRPAYGQDAFLQMVGIRPNGFGTLKLRDSNLASMPLIDPNYLADKRDLDLLVQGIKFAVKLVEETRSMRKINAKLLAFPIPGCRNHAFKSDAYWECLARHTTASAYKYSATTPMGKNQTDPIAVVDSKLRVFGTNGLRVVDASVLEERYVSVNHVTCTAIGELASDFILKEYQSKN